MRTWRDPKQFEIRIDTEKCSGEGCCVRICPNSVLAVKRLQNKNERHTFISRIKDLVLSNEKAVVENYKSCTACGRCEKICPEGAVKIEFLVN